jgi:hypothetical protein
MRGIMVLIVIVTRLADSIMFPVNARGMKLIKL